jgi:prepilin-type processing-associated H-X9-DG protein
MYAEDHEGIMPTVKTVWTDINADPSYLTCPTAGKDVANAYGYNAAANKVDTNNIENPAMILVTADGGNTDNLLVNSTDIKYRHSKKANVSYFDGRVASVTAENMQPPKK